MPADVGWFGGRGGVLVSSRVHTQRRTDLVQWGIGRVGGQGRRGDGRRQGQRPPGQYPHHQRTGAAQLVEQGGGKGHACEKVGCYPTLMTQHTFLSATILLTLIRAQ